MFIRCPAEPDLIEPISRYFSLMDATLDAQVIGPLILREIHFRLLKSPLGGMLRNLPSVESQASRITKATMQIRADFRQPLAVTDLARLAGMSQSSFHEHLKSVTGTTPLQYQKDLRMIEARGLLLGGNQSVSAVGYDIGYQSPIQFSSEYTRKYGVSPSRDAAAMSITM